MKTVSLLGLALLVTTSFVFAREGGGGSFRGAGVEDAGFRDDAPRLDEDDDNYRVTDNNGSADVNVRPEGDDTANVNVRTADGQDYNTTVAGPQGYRSGYVWQNGDYVAVNCDPFVPYAAPFGAWAGWNVVTQPDYVQYPVYSSFPVETAVEVALQKLGLYTGPIDGNAASVAGAIEQYQMQTEVPVTGTITPELLTALGIQASYQ
ncbi:MAG: hypothetical protein JHC85_14235 [Chthoniobacterales bacterium]|nr:hypothetical protein [Chthoniobacterales bacterium]